MPQRHPLNGTQRLQDVSNSALSRLLLESASTSHVERPNKRRKSGDGKYLDLPKLPVRQGKRPRLPPTLSGLHQPPPNAGLLPSISVKKPPPEIVSDRDRERDAAEEEATVPVPSTAEKVTGVSSSSPARKSCGKPKRNKWSDGETADLLKGAARFGIGSWTKILKCEDYHFEKRTALDLKDRFRVCCPSDYRPSSSTVAARNSVRTSTLQHEVSGKPARSDRKSATELHQLGISQPFAKTQRRRRHGYTAAEDEALLRGFEKYGNAWAAIRADDELDLSRRTATDLRDRLRTKYPEKYKDAGLVPRPENFPKPFKRGKEGAVHAQGDSEQGRKYSTSESANGAISENATTTISTPKQTSLKKQFKPPLLHYDDVFFGAPFDDNDVENEPIILDRGILEWASMAGIDNSRSSGIDPLATLKLPKPTVVAPVQHGMQLQSSALPSVADITSESQLDPGSQLELPSLMLGGVFENDVRVGGTLPSLEDLLS